MKQTDKSTGIDGVGILPKKTLKDRAKAPKGLWFIDRWEFDEKNREAAEAELKLGLSLELAKEKYGEFYKGRVFVGENLLLNEGINALWTLVAGGAETAFNNGNARLCVGDEVVAAAATQTDLQAVRNKVAWAPTTAYTAGLLRRRTAPTDATLAYQECTTGGTSGGTEPTWNETDGATTNDGTVVWTARVRKAYRPMDATFPTTGTLQRITFRSTYGAGDANFIWNEFSSDNGATPNRNLNRLVSAQGTKAVGQVWQLTLEITIS